MIHCKEGTFILLNQRGTMIATKKKTKRGPKDFEHLTRGRKGFLTLNDGTQESYGILFKDDKKVIYLTELALKLFNHHVIDDLEKNNYVTFRPSKEWNDLMKKVQNLEKYKSELVEQKLICERSLDEIRMVNQ